MSPTPQIGNCRLSSPMWQSPCPSDADCDQGAPFHRPHHGARTGEAYAIISRVRLLILIRFRYMEFQRTAALPTNVVVLGPSSVRPLDSIEKLRHASCVLTLEHILRTRSGYAPCRTRRTLVSPRVHIPAKPRNLLPWVRVGCGLMISYTRFRNGGFRLVVTIGGLSIEIDWL